MPFNPNIYKAVVRLSNTSPQENQDSVGSGVIFSSTGLVITNNHVIEDSDFGTAFGKITVESLREVDRQASEPVSAELIIRNEEYDLAILRMIGTPPAHFIDLLNTQQTDVSLMERRVRVLGYPPLGGATITVTRGIVSGFDEVGNIKTDAEINPGNSGGAALDEMYIFLGIPSFIVGDSGGKLGFIISVNRIKEWFGAALKSGIPEDTERLAVSFTDANLNFGDNNLDHSTKYPRILSKFAAVEMLLSRDQYQTVIPHIQFILSKRPRSALAYHYLGNALLGLGHYVDAAAQFRISLDYDPRRIPALGNLGVTLVQLERHNEALQIFEQVIDMSSNPAVWAAYDNIARIYDIWGKSNVAAQYRQKALELAADAAERLSTYTHHHDPADKIAAFANAFAAAEIEVDDPVQDEGE
jgi:hypothetical protein